MHEEKGMIAKMTYFGVAYLVVLLPLTALLYNLLPKKHRWKILLLVSYAFFWLISNKLIIYVIGTTFLIHYIGIWLELIQTERNLALKEAEKEQKKSIRADYLKKQRKVLAFGVIVNVGILLVVKYTGFIGGNINSLLQSLKIPLKLQIPKILMPIGISFYTLQAVSYLVDVYHEKIKADKNIARLSLYLTFFPQIMEGPICRYSETAMQLWEGNKITYESLKSGLLRMSYGIIKKMIIADRLNRFIGEIYTHYGSYDGGIMVVGMVLYTLQLYMDFSGTMDLAIGTSEIFGIKLPENFKQPFFSKNISEFWTRWHITLGAFFRDYIFYPLSLSEPLKKLTTNARKKIGKYYGPLIASAIALFCVWFCNGLWHGAAWTFIFFGMYHFILILSGKIFEPAVLWVSAKLHINRERKWYKGIQIIKTTLLVFVGELFFRATTVTAGFEMLGKMFTNFTFKSFTDGTILSLGMDIQDFIIIAIFTVLVFIISVMHEKDISVREKIAKKNIVIRWTIYYLIIFAIILFGAYGANYEVVQPMYANF